VGDAELLGEELGELDGETFGVAFGVALGVALGDAFGEALADASGVALAELSGDGSCITDGCGETKTTRTPLSSGIGETTDELRVNTNATMPRTMSNKITTATMMTIGFLLVFEVFETAVSPSMPALYSINQVLLVMAGKNDRITDV